MPEEMEIKSTRPEKIRLPMINPHLTCYLCKGYYIDATTISECMHSFCRSCIIKFLQEKSYCPICEVIINKTKPNLKLDKTLQDIVYKLVPELFAHEMAERQRFYRQHPELVSKVTAEQRGIDTERTIFNPRDTISLSMEYISDDSSALAILVKTVQEDPTALRRFLHCPGMCRIEVLKKFIQNKYNVDTSKFYIDILYKRIPLPDHYTLIDIAYIYSWKRNEPMKFFFKISDLNQISDDNQLISETKAIVKFESSKNVVKPIEKPIKLPSIIEKNKRLSPTHKLEKSPKKSNGIVHRVKFTDLPPPPAPKLTKPLKRPLESILKIPNVFEKTIEIGDEKRPRTLLDEAFDRLLAETPIDNRIKEINESKSPTNNIEVITKIQKVSNKNGLPIGLKITKETVKKPTVNTSAVTTTTTTTTTGNLRDVVERKEFDLEVEKWNFLKAFELRANVLGKDEIGNEKQQSPDQLQKSPKPVDMSKEQQLKQKSPMERKHANVVKESPKHLLKSSKEQSLKQQQQQQQQSPNNRKLKEVTKDSQNNRSPKDSKEQQQSPKQQSQQHQQQSPNHRKFDEVSKCSQKNGSPKDSKEQQSPKQHPQQHSQHSPNSRKHTEVTKDSHNNRSPKDAREHQESPKQHQQQQQSPNDRNITEVKNDAQNNRIPKDSRDQQSTKQQQQQSSNKRKYAEVTKDYPTNRSPKESKQQQSPKQQQQQKSPTDRKQAKLTNESDSNESVKEPKEKQQNQQPEAKNQELQENQEKLQPQQTTPQKRKNPNPMKMAKKSKTINNPAVKQMVTNVQQNATNVSKIVGQSVPSIDLQSLFDNYNINIPSSLSVTVKTEKDEKVPSAIQKPVQNYIEILKINHVANNTIQLFN